MKLITSSTLSIEGSYINLDIGSEYFDGSDELEMTLLNYSLDPESKEYKSVQMEMRVIDYLKSLGVCMKTDPSYKKDKYWLSKRNN